MDETTNDKLNTEKAEEAAQASTEPDQGKPRRKRPVKRIILLALAALFAVLLVVGGIFFLTYLHAGDTALQAMKSDGTVTVSETEYGYFFDGPSTEQALIFYPGARVDEIGDGEKVLLIRGSNDTVLNIKKYEEGLKLVPGNARELVIEGGNHAQFGDYGTQSGDGEATITVEEQQKQTADFILKELVP